MNTLIRTIALGMFGIALAAAPLNVSLDSGVATQEAAAKNGADNGGGDDREAQEETPAAQTHVFAQRLSTRSNPWSA